MSMIAAYMVPHPPMIVPDVGKGSEKQVEATIKAYEMVADEIADLEPDTIIISSPHSVMYLDYFHISPGQEASGSFAGFRAPQVSFHEKYDTELVEKISQISCEKGVPAGTLGEQDPHLDHGTMVPLYFIEKKYKDFKLVRTGLSGMSLADHYAFGQAVQQAVMETGRKTVYVASGDLSHKLQKYGPYGFAEEGPVYDEKIMDVCSRGAFGELFDFSETLCEKSAECGHRSFVIMAGALDGMEVTARALSHEDVTGVGYGICTFHPGGEDPDRHFLKKYLERSAAEVSEQMENSDEYVRLARASVESFVREGKRISVPDGLPEALERGKAGAFVSIHENGSLRGCIGTIMPTRDSLAEEIIENAISASTKDPRFDPIRPDELKYLEINVDVLDAPEDIESKDQLDVKRYGVIVTSMGRRGLLLPDLEGVDTVEQQISIAKRKAGIGEDEPVKLQRFEVIRHR